jgi:hypothetical protein
MKASKIEERTVRRMVNGAMVEELESRGYELSATENGHETPTGYFSYGHDRQLNLNVRFLDDATYDAAREAILGWMDEVVEND